MLLVMTLNVYELLCRFSTIQAADRIVVMDGGRVVEVGKPLVHFVLLQYSVRLVHYLHTLSVTLSLIL